MNILVTGGSRGIGAATVKYFAEHGNRVAFVYNQNDSAADVVANECGAYKIKADLSDFNAAEAAYMEAEKVLSGVDVLVNCAGIALISQICDTDSALWSKVINTNLTSAYAMCKAASQEMVRRKNGVIINVGSVWGRVGASCESAYSASKAGMRGLTMALAKELALSGIRVNCVEPGVIDTEMNHSLGSEALDAICEDIPLGRLGKAEEVAELIGFLASDKARYITGQIIGIDGGFGL
ncbi:MAG: 3-oxoacyl-ACP reductase FabG [Clostridia bacterium]|nr:3-oxoacyl-ACP reductase FabG [Clostridia bacterium]